MLWEAGEGALAVPILGTYQSRGMRQSAALLTAAIEIRPQGLRGEALFPQARREELNFEGGMRIHALQHIDEIDIGIDTLQATRR